MPSGASVGKCELNKLIICKSILTTEIPDPVIIVCSNIQINISDTEFMWLLEQKEVLILIVIIIIHFLSQLRGTIILAKLPKLPVLKLETRIN